MIDLKFRLMHKDATLPVRATTEAACFDLYASQRAIIHAGEHEVIHTGLAWECPPGYVGLIYSRSGHAKKGIRLANSVGVIDSDYRGEWMCVLHNDSSEVFVVNPRDRIAQFMLHELLNIRLQQVDVLGLTQRGTGGFGSTGQ